MSDAERRFAQVAIVTRTKDRPLLLRRAMETVLSQTMGDWLHIVVNDGGDDQMIEALRAQQAHRYEDRLIVLHNAAPMGMEVASNLGMAEADSRFITILDDDDTWHPQFLERMIAALERETWPNTKGVFCHTTIVYEQITGEDIQEVSRQDFNQHLWAIDLLDLSAWNRIVPVGFLFERSALASVGHFNEHLTACGDWEFNIRFLWKYEIAVLPEDLAFWHQRPDAAGLYGNSVIRGAKDHQVARARLINGWLRHSFPSNEQLGFGFGFGLVSEAIRKLDNLQNELEGVKWELQEISSRTRRRRWWPFSLFDRH